MSIITTITYQVKLEIHVDVGEVVPVPEPGLEQPRGVARQLLLGQHGQPRHVAPPVVPDVAPGPGVDTLQYSYTCL